MPRLDLAKEKTVTRQHRPNYLVIVYLGLLILLGVVVIFAIGPQRANTLNFVYGSNYSESYFVRKQIISTVLALVAFFGATFIPYQKIFKHAGKILGLGLLACLILLIANKAGLSFARETLGAVRWFSFSFGSFQPSEFLKLGLLLFFAVFVGDRYKKGLINDLRQTLLPVLIVLAMALLFVVIFQKDLGTGVVIISILATILFMGGLQWRQIGALSLVLVLILGLFIISSPHRIDRVKTYLNRNNNSQELATGKDYHIEQAKIAIGTGGWFGVGIGNSVQATGYLPESINDSIFAILAETFGFVGAVAVLLIFAFLLKTLLNIMKQLLDKQQQLVVAGLFGWLGAHIILNISSMLEILPLTGITLPFLSFGGTSMIFLAGGLGLVFQLSRYTSYNIDRKGHQDENFGSRGRFGRSRHSSGSRLS